MSRLNSITIHVIPRASRTQVVGRYGDAIKIRIAAPPVGGAANDELRRFLSKTLGVHQRAVEITGGHAKRRKTVSVRGLAANGVARTLLHEASGGLTT